VGSTAIANGAFGGACRGPRIQAGKPAQNLRQKRRNDGSALRREAGKQLDRRLFKTLGFQFNVEESTLGVFGEHIFEARQLGGAVAGPILAGPRIRLRLARGKQVGKTRLRYLQTMQSRIVTDNAAPIGAEANVEFEAVATGAQRLIEGEKCVFRRAPACPAMPKQQGAEMLRMRMSEYGVVVVHARFLCNQF
jgi:hypothetical protein